MPSWLGELNARAAPAKLAMGPGWGLGWHWGAGLSRRPSRRGHTAICSRLAWTELARVWLPALGITHPGRCIDVLLEWALCGSQGRQRAPEVRSDVPGTAGA